MPLSKASGLLVIVVDAGESLAILVKQSDLPVLVLSPLVSAQFCSVASFHFGNTSYKTINHENDIGLPRR